MSFMTNPPDGQIFTWHTTFHRFIWKAIRNRMHIRNEKMNPHIYTGFHRCTAVQIWSFPSSRLTCCPFTVGWLIVINLYKKLNIKLPLQKIRIRHKQCSVFLCVSVWFFFCTGDIWEQPVQLQFYPKWEMNFASSTVLIPRNTRVLQSHIFSLV